MKKCILVTGAAGFIGYHVVNKLAKLDYHIVGIDSVNDYYDTGLKFDRLMNCGIIKEKAAFNQMILSETYPS